MTNDDGSLKLKGRILIHGIRDADLDLVISDCAATDIILVRLVISLESLMGINFGTADINGAFMQSGPIQRFRGKFMCGHPRNSIGNAGAYGSC